MSVFYCFDIAAGSTALITDAPADCHAAGVTAPPLIPGLTDRPTDQSAAENPLVVSRLEHRGRQRSSASFQLLPLVEEVKHSACVHDFLLNARGHKCLKRGNAGIKLLVVPGCLKSSQTGPIDS